MSTLPSPTRNAQGQAALTSYTPNKQLTAESICPIETLDLQINNFFTYIYPLYPFPHEPSFRYSWERREDLRDRSFLALLASMIGVLMASIPHRPGLGIEAHKLKHLFPDHARLAYQCEKLCLLARGPSYLQVDRLSTNDAATSYFLATIYVYTSRWRLSQLYYGECLTIVRSLRLHKAGTQAYDDVGGFSTLT